MNKKSMLFFSLFLLLLIAGQSEADLEADLNGRWKGTLPVGSALEITIKVTENKIEGNGVMSKSGPDLKPSVSGTVDQEGKIKLQFYYPGGQSTNTFNCAPPQEGIMKC